MAPVVVIDGPRRECGALMRASVAYEMERPSDKKKVDKHQILTTGYSCRR